MRLLFDMVHPADAMFFHHAIRALEGDGVDVCIASRQKDVLTGLLDDLGHQHRPLSNARAGRGGQALELIERDLALLSFVRRWRPDVLVGFGGVAISHVGKLTNVPSVSFYDTEHAALQIGLTVPFISEWHVPQSWKGREAKGRTFRFRGSKQFAYLHPDRFQADPAQARAAGWDPACDNFIIRLVAWRANHDAGRCGIEPAQLREVVGYLSRLGKVHLSAEGDLPPDLEPLRIRGRPSAFHHLLAHCRLCFGESITVASEAAALGVPSVVQIDKAYAYVEEQERAGLIWRLAPGEKTEPALRHAIAEGLDGYRDRAEAFARTMGDVNGYIVDTVRRVSTEGDNVRGRSLT
ncbi:DUF354 domain-containing protein [Tsuneonella sp. HG249]